MYLKALELVGFKSFADKTRLEFEPGMTAIVGPNGCGKSNVSDAIRWALGETSAKALRGAQMADCIFSGADTHKPLGMAEVSLTLADCEKSLTTEFNEVTVSRRVFRSGEGQYFINKTPCRLKDVQRLFMDTGIGTSSYSFMEQGRIDRILSSRPEDRREVFEEASGITKFKTDKEEAIRKLERTETNLLRLADVIREVKRQIGSLQRQAGKARSYKALKDELRKLDIFATKQRLGVMDSNIARIETELSALVERLRAAHAEVEELERGNAVLRESLIQTEREIGSFHEAGAQARNELERSRALIRMNRQRIDEYRALAERDSKEINRAGEQIAGKRKLLDDLAAQAETTSRDQRSAEADLTLANEKWSEHQRRMDVVRAETQKLRDESLEMEGLASKLRNQLSEIEARERSAVFQRERLSAEKAQLARVAAAYEKRKDEMTQTLETMNEDVKRCESALREAERRKEETLAEIAAAQGERADLQSEAAAKRAQIELLGEDEEAERDLPGGASVVMRETGQIGIERAEILGSIVSLLEVERGYETAVAAALRDWLDAILVTNSATALEAIRFLQAKKTGAARIVAVDAARKEPDAAPSGFSRLVDHVKCASEIAPAINSLLGNAIVAESLDSISCPLSPAEVYVTKDGAVIRGDGRMEFWMSEPHSPNPLARKNLLADARRVLAETERRIEERMAAAKSLCGQTEEMESAASVAKAELDRSVRAMAQKEGETQVVSKEALESRERLETVSWELDNLVSREESGDMEKEAIARRMDETRGRREKIAADMSALAQEAQELESKRSDLNSEVTTHRIRLAELSQKVEHLNAQRASLKASVDDLVALADTRSQGVLSYEANARKLEEEIGSAEAQLGRLEEAVSLNAEKAENLRKNREKQAKELGEMENELTQKRASLEEIRQSKSDLDVRHAETKMRRQNTIDRLTAEQSLTMDQFLSEPAPEWEGDAPSLEANETRIAEIRTKIEAMGPVNLGADQEYKELEERYAFLTAQESDLVNAKQQLMDMIRKINKTTTEMFKSTFDRVNENFQAMFEKLFNGGSAKLVLVNEEDVLECGIEIIARPPGKRLQNVSLLSGGERTLTAVALLFAIYMIKPSPFCLLDELDAALDETNIGRFVSVLKDFLAQSQFVVITHNRQTIAAANALYGVTMAEKGVSSIVSMRFNSRDGKPAATPAPAPSPAPAAAPEPAPAEALATATAEAEKPPAT